MILKFVIKIKLNLLQSYTRAMFSSFQQLLIQCLKVITQQFHPRIEKTPWYVKLKNKENILYTKGFTTTDGNCYKPTKRIRSEVKNNDGSLNLNFFSEKGNHRTNSRAVEIPCLIIRFSDFEVD